MNISKLIIWSVRFTNGNMKSWVLSHMYIPKISYSHLKYGQTKASFLYSNWI